MPTPDEIQALTDTTDYCLEFYREIVSCLEYACTIDSDKRRGVFIKAYMEDEGWAISDFNRWLERKKTDG